MPPISATKSLTGHSQGAAGVHEAIYTLLMMRHGFIAESANIEEIDPAVADATSCAQAHRRREDPHRHVEQLRLRRHQCLAGVPAVRRVNNKNRAARALSQNETGTWLKMAR